ncbi:hypothetical protein Golax_022177, partial [Gossypium laxum]|nr:hypothetical protein [Gossypium laxum]
MTFGKNKGLCMFDVLHPKN